MNASGSPGLIERVLRRLAGAEIAEAAWGDLMEEAAAVQRRRGRILARLWIAMQSLQLVFGLLDPDLFAPGRWAREVAMDDWTDRRRKTVALVGVLAGLPAAVLVVSGLLYSLSGSEAIARALDATLFNGHGFFYRVVLHPVTVLGGLAVALALNLIPLLRLDVDRAGQTARATVALRLRRTHLAIAAAGLGLLAAILAYAFTENFDVVRREAARIDAPPAVAASAVGVGWTAVRHTGGEWNTRPILIRSEGADADFLEFVSQKWRIHRRIPANGLA